ncbi:MAG: tRNA (adenosine(37)-N6)-threonylcarbamoyltransferase complex dimerization subunit type 1 TsaB [Altibacter sp.]|uniref:tRNA (adenosine(37)-N6)-threonylcarbamoyltransferase complex dimerization subunit type 1 TsaB n=1 Tax=Altibacter sp. TaxID=2024823 RepID=UPI001E0C6CEF|nr:tRNA (adenosine(37)-N6)-threonylcarbamoyltransferase complex dimerization subunit type 1 TsaB [Altibacter sp.]MBZ0328439.1 tRNA (adenosine(37)-N6)-threonylcarbamoyltransferase complex dimerization subunit type 1 TsaB [Altibacter sp.]
MASILCLETATTNCSVALSVNGSAIAIQEDVSKNYSHAEMLHPFITQVLADANIKMEALDAVAVSKGPGSFTGLRIGVSAAKGICFALDIPLISIPTLESLALQAITNAIYVVPMLDARRMEVYAAVFSKGKEIRTTEAEILNDGSFSEYLEKGKVVFIGDGVEKFKTLCTHSNAIFLEEKFPSAREMTLLAESKYKKNDTEDVAYFEPYYLKDFISN